jgi:hypothetical protein
MIVDETILKDAEKAKETIYELLKQENEYGKRLLNFYSEIKSTLGCEKCKSVKNSIDTIRNLGYATLSEFKVISLPIFIGKNRANCYNKYIIDTEYLLENIKAHVLATEYIFKNKLNLEILLSSFLDDYETEYVLKEFEKLNINNIEENK